MSKWVNTDKFEEFKTERSNDKQEDKNAVTYARKWPNPKMGTNTNPKEYHTRLIPDTDGNFYKKFHYHMFQSGETWFFILCPKTKSFDEYCPWCTLNQILYTGNDADKKRAYQYKRKDKFVSNIYIVKDPRDVDESDVDKHFTGKTFLYEFPATIEQLIKKEVTDVENGWGFKIFDPEDGHNLIINIGAKKPDKNSKIWPDYSLTTFSKRPTPMCDDVDGVMGTVQNINEYFENSYKTNEEHAEILKSEMVFDDVKDTFMRFMPVGGDIEEPKKETPKKETPKKEEPKKEESKGAGDMSESDIDDLLNDL